MHAAHRFALHAAALLVAVAAGLAEFAALQSWRVRDGLQHLLVR